MPLATGDKLGPYKSLFAIGAGGMGEVYKARDTRLECTVAGSIELLSILLKSISVQDEKTGAPVLIGLRDRAHGLHLRSHRRGGGHKGLRITTFKKARMVRLSELKWRF